MNISLKTTFTAIILFFTFHILNAQEVKTKHGFLKGVVVEDIVVYKGVPYAEAPVGDLRWRAPKPPLAWEGVRLADTFSPICMQIGMYPRDSPEEEMSEDCLYLNIWKPQAVTNEKLPVMLWLYGGGLTNGSASTSIYSGEHLARQNVIVVTVNYRLGALGFLAHPELSEEATYHSSGNYGLLDMIAALRWIQDNIESFGGDPKNVTVFGQSSGAIAISALMASPLASGLFDKAICQSGGLYEPIALDQGFSLTASEQAGVRFATRAGVSSIEELRNIAADDLVKVPVNTSIVIDGYALKQSPFEAYQQNDQPKIAVLLGNTTAEGQSFISDLRITMETYADELGKHFPGWLVWLSAPDPGASDDEAMKAAVEFEGDIRFKWNMWTWAKLASESKSNSVYLYQFAHSPPSSGNSEKSGWGAAHGSDLAYVFGQQNDAWEKDDRDLSDAMVKYWTNFAKHGNPNSEGLPHWPEFSAENPQYLALGKDINSYLFTPTEALSNLDRIYASARFVLKHYIALLAFSVMLIAFLIFSAIKFLGNRRMAT